MENRAVTYFREYLRIPSVHPDPDYNGCVTFLKRLAKENGLDFSVTGSTTHPVVILTWPGSDKTAGSILLNSHMDVVPAFKKKWTHDPFAAVKDEKGDIYGRGAQDCKCIGIQYVEAIRRLIEEGFKPKRTVHVSFVPDEEIGGQKGMGEFVKSQEFQKLNVAFTIDEGAPSDNGEYLVFNNERCALPFKITCCGQAGHGSLLHPNTAGEKLCKVLGELMDYRDSQVQLNSKLPDIIRYSAEVTTVNLTILEGGIQNNVVPPELSMTFDLRLSIHTDPQDFFNWLQGVCSKAGEGVSYQIVGDSFKAPGTKTNESNMFWVVMERLFDEMKLKVLKVGCPGATDSRFLRMAGIPSLGFSPIINTPLLVHGNNERLNEAEFLRGINITKNIIKELVQV